MEMVLTQFLTFYETEGKNFRTSEVFIAVSSPLLASRQRPKSGNYEVPAKLYECGVDNFEMFTHYKD